MSQNFASAAGRHWNDADSLFNGNRFDNAAYLSGYTVECAWKVLVEAGGISPRPVGHDLASLGGAALSLAYHLAPALRRYDIPGSADLAALVQGWNPEMRYAQTGEVDRNTAEIWLRGAERVYTAIVAAALLDGWNQV